MHTVNKSQVSLMKGTVELVGEASSMGLAPSEWPDFIAVLDDKNKGFLFQRGERLEDGGFRYQSRTSSAFLTVIND